MARINDNDRQAYGDELLDVVARKALDSVQPYVERLEQKVARYEAQTIYQVLTAQLPNWRQINTSREFLQWLSVPDMLSGQRKDSLLRGAFESGDANRCLAIFKGLSCLPDSTAPGMISIIGELWRDTFQSGMRLIFSENTSPSPEKLLRPSDAPPSREESTRQLTCGHRPQP